jgi:hypothetical protein
MVGNVAGQLRTATIKESQMRASTLAAAFVVALCGGSALGVEPSTTLSITDMSDLDPTASVKLTVYTPNRAPLMLDARITKRTHAAEFRVSYSTSHKDDSWRFFTGASYESATGLRTAQLLPIIQRIIECTSHHTCLLFEAFSFDVSESDLRWAAERHRDWRFKFIAKSGETIEESLTPSHISAVLKATTMYTEQLPPRE